jgi:hypothetical protein
MLNFNRTFEQQMLFSMSSVFADDVFNTEGERVAPKTLDEAIESFLSMMQKDMRKKLELEPAFKTAQSEEAKIRAADNFSLHFKQKYHLNPRTGNVLTATEIDDVNKKAKELDEKEKQKNR